MKNKTRIEQKKETRELILKTAKHLFLEKNYYKTTLRDIAATAGIATGTILAHFPNKPSLLAATLIDDVEEVLKNAYETLPADGEIIEMLTHPIKALYTHFSLIPNLSKTWVKETEFIEGQWGDRVNAQLERSRLMILYILQEAKKQEKLIEKCDCDLLSKGIMSHYFYVLVTGLQQNLSVKQQIELFTRLVECLLSGDFYNKNKAKDTGRRTKNLNSK